jgi:hypothetical protein
VPSASDLSQKSQLSQGLDPQKSANLQTVAKVATVAGGRAWDVDDWQFAIEERSAVLEFDEGMSRLEADALAAEQIVDQRRRGLA